MDMTWIDWAIVIGITSVVMYAAMTTRRHTKGVADFLAAGRCAERYMLVISTGMAGMGAVSMILSFEMFLGKRSRPLGRRMRWRDVRLVLVC